MFIVSSSYVGAYFLSNRPNMLKARVIVSKK